MPNFLKIIWAVSSLSIEKKKDKCIKKCHTLIMALHIIATMLPNPHFICRAKLIHTKIAYKNYILKLAYAKLASFN